MSSVLEREEGLATGDRAVSQIIDVDVHPAHRESIGALLPYIPTSWRERRLFLENGFMVVQGSPFPPLLPHVAKNTKRVVERPSVSGPGGLWVSFLHATSH